MNAVSARQMATQGHGRSAGYVCDCERGLHTVAAADWAAPVHTCTLVLASLALARGVDTLNVNIRSTNVTLGALGYDASSTSYKT